MFCTLSDSWAHTFPCVFFFYISIIREMTGQYLDRRTRVHWILVCGEFICSIGIACTTASKYLHSLLLYTWREAWWDSFSSSGMACFVGRRKDWFQWKWNSYLVYWSNLSIYGMLSWFSCVTTLLLMWQYNIWIW